jgi:hypothetical protein
MKGNKKSKSEPETEPCQNGTVPQHCLKMPRTLFSHNLKGLSHQIRFTWKWYGSTGPRLENATLDLTISFNLFFYLYWLLKIVQPTLNTYRT